MPEICTIYNLPIDKLLYSYIREITVSKVNAKYRMVLVTSVIHLCCSLAGFVHEHIWVNLS